MLGVYCYELCRDRNSILLEYYTPTPGAGLCWGSLRYWAFPKEYAATILLNFVYVNY